MKTSPQQRPETTPTLKLVYSRSIGQPTKSSARKWKNTSAPSAQHWQPPPESLPEERLSRLRSLSPEHASVVDNLIGAMFQSLEDEPEIGLCRRFTDPLPGQRKTADKR